MEMKCLDYNELYNWLDKQVGRDLIEVAAEMRTRWNLTHKDVFIVIDGWMDSEVVKPEPVPHVYYPRENSDI